QRAENYNAFWTRMSQYPNITANALYARLSKGSSICTDSISHTSTLRRVFPIIPIPQNILLTNPYPSGDVKLCDFGISRILTKGAELREIVGTPDYVGQCFITIAPEILQYEPISLATDMWSIGILTYVLLSGHSPFTGETKQETYCNITNGSLDFPSYLFADVSEEAKDFICKLLVRDPKYALNIDISID
ncbi:unnamed protein product, partial [Medioppia subpectinata]